MNLFILLKLIIHYNLFLFMEEINRQLRLYARSDLNTFIVVSIPISKSVIDITEYIHAALSKVKFFNNELESFKVEHIEISNLKNYGRIKENNFEVYP